MPLKLFFYRMISIALLSIILFNSNINVRLWQMSAIQPGLASEASVVTSSYFLPSVMNTYPWPNPFGAEATVILSQGSAVLTKAVQLHLGWVRLNGRVSWRELQPNESGPIQWSQLADFEKELKAIRAAGLTPVIILDDYPSWAVDIVRKNGKPASCGPISSSKFTAFASFVGAVVARFKTPEFNVHHWELGNEPDIDPDLVEENSMFGCWGNIDDPFYGGEHYGEMLKVIGPVIKTQDPSAKVWIGGLLLDKPLTTDPKFGRPELFFQGILESGAAPYFDVVPYHWYTGYTQEIKDYDLDANIDWKSWGGGTVGKATFLRQVMQSYGVTKPLYLNESGLTCPVDLNLTWCQPPGPAPQFFEVQADYLVRSYTRGFKEGIAGFFWYTINGPGWRFSGLLDKDGVPRPVYNAYQQLTSRLQNTRLLGPVDYGQEIEAYAFKRKSQQVHILWTIANTSLFIAVPEAKFSAAYKRDGAQIILSPVNGFVQVPVNFSPIYLVLNP